MSRHYEIMRQFFRDDDWPVEELDGEVVRTAFKGTNGRYPCVAYAQGEVVSFLAISPREAPEQERERMMELLTRANYGLRCTAFELDLSDGQVRCRAGVHVSPEDLTVDIVQKLVYVTMVAMDKYYPAIAGVLLSGKSPATLIEGIEG